MAEDEQEKKKKEEEEEVFDFNKPDIFSGGGGITTNEPPAKTEEPEDEKFDFNKPDIFSGGGGITTNAPTRAGMIAESQKQKRFEGQKTGEGVPLTEAYTPEQLERLITPYPVSVKEWFNQLRNLKTETAEEELRKEETLREATGLNWRKYQYPVEEKWHKWNPKGRKAYLTKYPNKFFDEETQTFKTLPRPPISGGKLVWKGEPGYTEPTGSKLRRSRIGRFVWGLPDDDIKKYENRSGYEKHGILGILPDAMLAEALGLDELEHKKGLETGRELGPGMAGWEKGRKLGGKALAFAGARGKLVGNLIGGMVGGALGLTGGRAAAKGELLSPSEQALAFGYGAMGHGRYALPLAKRIPAAIAEAGLISEFAQQSQAILDEGEFRQDKDWSSWAKRNALQIGLNGVFRGMQTRRLSGQTKEQFHLAQANHVRKSTVNLLKLRHARYSEMAVKKPGKSRGQTNKAKEYRDWLGKVIKRYEEYGIHFEPASQHESQLILQAARAESGRKSVRDSLDALILKSARPLAAALASGRAKEVQSLIDLMKKLKKGEKGEGLGVSAYDPRHLSAVRDDPKASEQLKKLLGRIIKDSDVVDLPPEAQGFLSTTDKRRREHITYASPWGAFQRKVDDLYGGRSDRYSLEWALENRGINSRQAADVLAFDKAVSSRLREPAMKADFNGFALISRIEKRLENAASKKAQIKELESELKLLKGMVKKSDESLFKRQDLKEHNQYTRQLETMLDGLKKMPEDRIYAELDNAGKVMYYVSNKTKDAPKGSVNIHEIKKEFYDRLNKTPGRLAELQDIGKAFQKQAEKVRKLYLDKGLISQLEYKELGARHDVYYPFQHLKYVEDVSGIPSPLTGVSKSWKIVDIVDQMRNQISSARKSAEHNEALLEIYRYGRKDLKEVGGEGQLMRRAPKEDKDIPPGWRKFTVRIGGGREKFIVDESVVTAYKTFVDPSRLNLFKEKLGRPGVLYKESGKYLKGGVTKYSMSFQMVNMLASDALTNALTAKSGIRWYGLDPVDWFVFANDNLRAFLTAWTGNVRMAHKGKKLADGLYKDMLESGLLRQNMDSAIDPLFKARRITKFDGKIEGLKGLKDRAVEYVDILPDAIEEMGKIVGVRRQIRHEGAKSLTDLLKKNDFFAEAIYRNEFLKQTGSPQFTRFGEAGATLDQLFMFYNARMQGIARDLHRVTDYNSPEGRAAMARVGVAITGPTAALQAWNLAHNKEWLDKVPSQVRKNYWIIFKPNMIELEDGTPMKDYYRIPKRDIFKLVANLTEMGMNQIFANDKNTVADYALEVADNISPINFEGKGWGGRLETLVSGMHPWIKYGYERAAGEGGRIRESWTHRYLLSKRAADSADPAHRVRKSTPKAYRVAGGILGVGPEDLRHALKTFTGDKFTQFFPRGEPVKGRSDAWNNPVVRIFLRRIIAPAFSQNEKQEKEFRLIKSLDAENAINSWNTAEKWVEDNVTFERGAGRDLWVRRELDLLAGKSYPTTGTADDKRINDYIGTLLDTREHGQTFDMVSLSRQPARDRAKRILFMLGQRSAPISEGGWGWSEEKTENFVKYLESQERVLDDSVYEWMGVLHGISRPEMKEVLKKGRERFKESR